MDPENLTIFQIGVNRHSIWNVCNARNIFYSKTDKKEKNVNILRYLIIENLEIMEKTFLYLFKTHMYSKNITAYFIIIFFLHTTKSLCLYKYDCLKKNLRDAL